MTAGSPDDAPRIRVLVADDQALIRRGMTLMLAAESDMEVVGQASDGVEAVEMAQRFRPDVVLMDLHMPRKGGVAATREITLLLPRTHVLVLTTLDAEETVFEAVRAGAQAYLLKDASEDEVLETVRAVHRGESRLTPQIARKVMDQFRRLASASEAAPAGTAVNGAAASIKPSGAAQGKASGSVAETLSDKEEAILSLIAEGKSNKQIAAAVFLAEGTVKNYVSRIMEKLHANTRTELAVMSVRQRRGD
ncbi:MAG: DNA-binding response regulator [Betaproteobacteria bacterium RIFCSPLOWO2_12_FULL_62_13b]|nr:MAG: DNA-binding response regulator [Betaproteobacteria bacterium RIFCSPLOWO2_12_FULL_62_13b]